MNVRQNDISRIIMYPKHKGLSRPAVIAPHFLDPLSRSDLVQGYDAVMGRLILRLSIVPDEGERQENCETEGSERKQGSLSDYEYPAGVSISPGTCSVYIRRPSFDPAGLPAPAPRNPESFAVGPGDTPGVSAIVTVFPFTSSAVMP